MALLAATNLSKVYRDDGPVTVALEGFNLEIQKGEFVSIMGPSGSGKSTLLHLLGLLDRPTDGKYFFDGKDVSALTDEEAAHTRNAKIGFVFQAFNLLPRTNVLGNVTLPLMYSPVLEDEWQAKANAAIDAVGLSERRDHEPSELSGGEKQRVAIARALVTEPSVVFADEPTGNLDSVSGSHVMQIFDKLHESGTTVILITHNEKVAHHAHRLIKLRDGRLESDSKI